MLVLLGVARSVGKVSRLGSVATSTASATAASAAAHEEEAAASSVRKWEKRKRKQRPSRNRSKILLGDETERRCGFLTEAKACPGRTPAIFWSIAPSDVAGAPASAWQARPAAASVAGWSSAVTDGSTGASPSRRRRCRARRAWRHWRQPRGARTRW